MTIDELIIKLEADIKATEDFYNKNYPFLYKSGKLEKNNHSGYGKQVKFLTCYIAVAKEIIETEGFKNGDFNIKHFKTAKIKAQEQLDKADIALRIIKGCAKRPKI